MWIPSQIAHLWWTNFGPTSAIRQPNVGIGGWHHVVLAGRRNVGSPSPTSTHHRNQWLAQRYVIGLASNVEPTNVQRLGQRWTTIYFCHGEPTLRPPDKMTLNQPLLPTLGHRASVILVAINIKHKLFTYIALILIKIFNGTVGLHENDTNIYKMVIKHVETGES